MMGVDLKALKEKRKKVQSRMAGGFFRVREGKNRLRVVPWKMPDGQELLDLEETVHFIGRGKPELCDGEGCIKCQEAAELMSSSVEAERTQGKRMRAQVKYCMQVADRTEDNDAGGKLQRWAAPSTAYVAIAAIVEMKEEYGLVLDPKEGRDVIVEYDPKAKPQDMYKVNPAGSPSEIDLSKLKPAPFPPSVEAALKEGNTDGIRGNSSGQFGGAGEVAEGTASDEAEMEKPTELKEGENGSYECEGVDYDPNDGFCKKCERASICRRKMAHKGT